MHNTALLPHRRKARLKLCELYLFLDLRTNAGLLTFLLYNSLITKKIAGIKMWSWVHFWSQHSSASWILLIVFVSSFLAGVNEAAASSICWILQMHENTFCTLKHIFSYLQYKYDAQNSISVTTLTKLNESFDRKIQSLNITYVAFPKMFLKLSNWRP